MWIRLRGDIGWRDLAAGAWFALSPGAGNTAQQQLEDYWSRGTGDALACLSVRSGFDLLLSALDLSAGSEVLFSAVTIPDMPRIARLHGLVPVPVDVSGTDFQIDADSLRSRITPRSRMVVAAPLLGAAAKLDGVLPLAREHGLFLVEDCAQAWRGRDWRGNDAADASLFSFGPIKTGTALGGALCRIRDPRLLARMRTLQHEYPIQSRGRLLSRIGKYAVLKALSSYRPYALATRIARTLGRTPDDLLQTLTRGFAAGHLLPQLRQRPSSTQLRLLSHRLRTYDQSRFDRRRAHARTLIDALGLRDSQPELLAPDHGFWLFPLRSDRPEELIEQLRRAGFDAGRRGRLEVVLPPPERPECECPRAKQLLKDTVFLPCYPELSNTAVASLCEWLQRGGVSIRPTPIPSEHSSSTSP